MRHTVGFQITRSRQVPRAGADRDLRLEQAARLGAAATAQRMFGPRLSQQTIQRGGADFAQEFPLTGGELAVVTFVVAQPERQRRGQAFATRLFGGQPDRPHHRFARPEQR